MPPPETLGLGGRRVAPPSRPLIPVPRRSGEEVAMSLVVDPVPSSDGVPRLGERDLELIRHLADGMSTGRIAAAMSVTTNTVRSRIRRVQRKVAAPGRGQVVARARQLRVI
jgi:DNA-binding CsgD family transcriptional regulator